MTDTSGFMFNQTAMDPSCSPPGANLYVMGAVFPGEKGRDQRYLRDTTLAFEEDIKVMWPGSPSRCGGDGTWCSSRRSG